MSYEADSRDRGHVDCSNFQICGGQQVRKIAIFKWLIVHSTLEKRGVHPPGPHRETLVSMRRWRMPRERMDHAGYQASRLSRLGLISWMLGL